MTPSAFVQRNPYKGTPPRSWVRLRFAAPDGSWHERDLLADTGCPCHVILGLTDFTVLMGTTTSNRYTNFGQLPGALLQLSMPELGLTTQVDGYGSDVVLQAVQRDCPDFTGMAGLPLLRMLEYGGDATVFWILEAAGTP